MVNNVSFYYFAFVTESDVELFVAVVCVVLEDVPQDRPAADRYHGLWLDFRFFSQAGSLSAG